MSSCSAFDERRLRWNFNRSETSKHWRVKKYLNIQKVWVNWHKWPRKHFRGKWIQFDRAESELFAELSLFALQKSSGATLYKWAKLLSILNIILTSQQNEQQLLPTNKNQRQTVDNLTARTLLNLLPPQNFSGLSSVTRLRAGSHYRQFGRKSFTLWTKICQHISFLMRPLICDCSKIPKSEKTSETPLCLDGADLFSKYRKTKGARRQSCQQLKGMTPNIDRKVTNVQKSTKFHHSQWRFHRVRFEVTAWTSEILPFLITAIKCREVSSFPSFRTWATHR